ncbi:hypothetical protein NDU88_006977 [Pleurodeles waltl]|uniref:Uncharacterized protein n=1 Tax=Pleurodeles waltl TaxID=8319 RepID=A0AAV7UQM6_PLEWA|nr:hypothetical protein NDU88_006977 [Pleurodeles waltl]
MRTSEKKQKKDVKSEEQLAVEESPTTGKIDFSFQVNNGGATKQKKEVDQPRGVQKTPGSNIERKNAKGAWGGDPQQRRRPGGRRRHSSQANRCGCFIGSLGC